MSLIAMAVNKQENLYMMANVKRFWEERIKFVVNVTDTKAKFNI